MTDKQFNEMIVLYERLSELIDKYKDEFVDVDNTPKQIILPEDVYDKICVVINESKIILLGIS